MVPGLRWGSSILTCQSLSGRGLRDDHGGAGWSGFARSPPGLNPDWGTRWPAAKEFKNKVNFVIILCLSGWAVEVV